MGIPSAFCMLGEPLRHCGAFNTLLTPLHTTHSLLSGALYIEGLGWGGAVLHVKFIKLPSQKQMTTFSFGFKKISSG